MELIINQFITLGACYGVLGIGYLAWLTSGVVSVAYSHKTPVELGALPRRPAEVYITSRGAGAIRSGYEPAGVAGGAYGRRYSSDDERYQRSWACHNDPQKWR